MDDDKTRLKPSATDKTIMQPKAADKTIIKPRVAEETQVKPRAADETLLNPHSIAPYQSDKTVLQKPKRPVADATRAQVKPPFCTNNQSHCQRRRHH